jgi:choline monooxygenase
MAPSSADPFVFQPDLAQATTLPSRFYFDPEHFERERARVFHRTWQIIAREEELASLGDYLTGEVQGEPVVVVRGEDGLRAFYNVCRHRAGPVAEGAGNRRSLQCRYHGWTYGLDGRLLSAPEMEGVRCFDRGAVRLPQVALGTFGGFVLLNLDKGAAPLAETFGPVEAETRDLPLRSMRRTHRVDYEIACNWKVYVDNYLEGYHIPVAHPGLFQMLDYRSYKVETGRFHSKQHAPVRSIQVGQPDPPTQDGDASLYRRRLPEGRSPQALYYWIFPNLMLNVYPDHVQINLILPLSPERTVTRFEWYFLDPERPDFSADFARSFAFSDLVQKEDIALCEAVQRGLRSRSYDRGRFSVARENGVHHFHGLLCHFLGQGAAP